MILQFSKLEPLMYWKEYLPFIRALRKFGGNNVTAMHFNIGTFTISGTVKGTILYQNISVFGAGSQADFSVGG